MAVPTILPTKATPVDVVRKRKHSQVIDLTAGGDEEDIADRRRSASANLEARDRDPQPHTNEASTNGVNHDIKDTEQDLDQEDDEDDEEVEELDPEAFEDMMDELESNQYIIDDGSPLKKDEAAALIVHLRHVGPHAFFEETINGRNMNPRVLGTAFGLDPDMFADNDEMYLQIFGAFVVRFYSKRRKLPQYNTIDDAAKLLTTSHNIMVITGAGVSTSLGIPDFRSKGTGFYERIKSMGYSEPEEVFDIENFDADPSVFYSLAGDLLPKWDKFSPTHAFIRLLQDKDRLQTNYTQNIDNIEELAGIDPRRIIQCHGSFATASCRICKHQVKGTAIFEDIRHKRIAYCSSCKDRISKAVPRPPPKPKKKFSLDDNDDEDEDDNIPQPGVMKPDITFFGEQLPTTFFDRFADRDAQQTDLVLVIGTSLKVAPVSEMPNHLPHQVPHIYISREPIRHVEFDIQLLGNCDDVVFELAKRAGWVLRHEMIPEGLEVEVRKASEEQENLWFVRRSEGEAQRTAVDGGDEEVGTRPAAAS